MAHCEFSGDGRLYMVSATILYANLHPVPMLQRSVAEVLVFHVDILLLSHQSGQPADWKTL